ncbi:hypothetical protein Q3G72_010507 [Acer saccharum]|nr:hypothetical protein Q3G72_010507 [Acer saccharum]
MKRAAAGATEPVIKRVRNGAMEPVMTEREMERVTDRVMDRPVMKRVRNAVTEPVMTEREMDRVTDRVMDRVMDRVTERVTERVMDLEQVMKREMQEMKRLIETLSKQSAPADCNGNPRTSLDQVGTSEGRGYQLLFANKLPSTIFTDSKIEAEFGGPVKIVLIDTISTAPVTSGPLSSIKIQIFVLDGDFGFEAQENWTEQDFNNKVVHERDGKRPLVTGELNIMLRDGVGIISDLSFTDNSSWIKYRKFRLGARVVQSIGGHVRIKEAISEAFVVKDHRIKRYGKHHPPSLDDEVWRLEKIRKDGKFHQRLASHQIDTVKDFMRMYVTYPTKLREMLDCPEGAWNTIVEHAFTCNVNNEIFYTYSVEGIGLLFNSVYKLVATTFDGQNYQFLDDPTFTHKPWVETIKKQAYRNVSSFVQVNRHAIFGPSNPLISLQAEPYNSPTSGLQHPEFPVAHAGSSEIQSGFDHASPSTSYNYGPEDHSQQSHFSVAENTQPIQAFEVREEVERAILTFSKDLNMTPRTSLNQVETSEGRILQLLFVNKLPSTIFTGSKIVAEDGGPIIIDLIDSISKRRVTSGPYSSIQIQILVLNGDFGFEDQENWTEREFSAKVVRERDGRKPLVTGELNITFKDGVGIISDISFTDNSSWIRCRKFRLGARLLKSIGGQVRIKEARSEAFVVKDHRGELYKKHYPPLLEDEVWRLEKIAKDGKYHTRLTSHNIHSVKDFLRLYVIDPNSLKRMLDCSNRAWDTIVEHASTCGLNDEIFYTYSGEGIGLLFNSIYKLVAATFDGQNYQFLDDPTFTHKPLVETIKKQAYRNVNSFVPVDGRATFGPSKSLSSLQDEPITGSTTGLQHPEFPVVHQGLAEMQIDWYHATTSSQSTGGLGNHIHQLPLPIPQTFDCNLGMDEFFSPSNDEIVPNIPSKMTSTGVVQFDTTQIKFLDMDSNNVLTSTEAEGGLVISASKAVSSVSPVNCRVERSSPVRPSPIINGVDPSNRNMEKPRTMDDVNVIEKTKHWQLAEIAESGQCRLVTLPESTDSSSKVVRLLYTNSGVGILALGSSGIQKLWKWPRNDQNPSGKATASVVPHHWLPCSGLIMTNDISGVNLEEAVPCIALSKNDSYVISATGGKVSLFNRMTFKVMTTFMPPPPASTFLAFHPQDNNIIAIGMEDSTILIYNCKVDEVKSILEGHHKRITGLAFSSNLNILVSSGADAQLSVWSIDTWEKKKSVTIQIPIGKAPNGDTRVQFHSDQIRMLVVHETQLVIYDASKMEGICQWVPQDVLSAPISCATYSCNSQLVYATFCDGNIGVFDADTLRLRCHIAPPAYLSQAVLNGSQAVYPLVVAAHPFESNQFAIGLTDGTVKVLEPLEPKGKWGVSPPGDNGMLNGRTTLSSTRFLLKN